VSVSELVPVFLLGVMMFVVEVMRAYILYMHTHDKSYMHTNYIDHTDHTCIQITETRHIIRIIHMTHKYIRHISHIRITYD
jgi:hypothetical protein